MVAISTDSISASNAVTSNTPQELASPILNDELSRITVFAKLSGSGTPSEIVSATNRFFELDPPRPAPQTLISPDTISRVLASENPEPFAQRSDQFFETNASQPSQEAVPSFPLIAAQEIANTTQTARQDTSSSVQSSQTVSSTTE